MRNSDLGLPDSVVFVQQRVFAANVLPLFAVARIARGQVPVEVVAIPLLDVALEGRAMKWSLVIFDPLRKEAAPFSGSYFKLLRHKGEIPDTCERVDEAAVVRFIKTCHLLPDTNNRR
jgi:hypothetical protein